MSCSYLSFPGGASLLLPPPFSLKERSVLLSLKRKIHITLGCYITFLSVRSGGYFRPLVLPARYRSSLLGFGVVSKSSYHFVLGQMIKTISFVEVRE